MTVASEIVARARALVGARFRPQGRHAGAGLDCVGVAALAVAAPQYRSDYRLRGGSLDALEAELARAGLGRAENMGAGDVLVMRSGPQQLHLGIWTGESLVHADAGLRRVVERPGLPPWPVLGAWRKESSGWQR